MTPSETYDQLGGQPNDTPPPVRARGCGRPFCNHPDNHVCPWLNEDHLGRVVPCGCSHEPQAKGRT